MIAAPPKLLEAMPREGHSVHLRFADGLAADVDLAYLIGRGPVFEPLRDIEYFRRLRVDELNRTVTWPNEADISPWTLYDHVQSAVYGKRAVDPAR